jgi:hypothetical protein
MRWYPAAARAADALACLAQTGDDAEALQAWRPVEIRRNVARTLDDLITRLKTIIAQQLNDQGLLLCHPQQDLGLSDLLGQDLTEQ